MNYSWEIAKLIFYLALVLSLIYLINLFLKKKLTGQKKGEFMEVIEQVYLAPKKSLVLMRIKEEILLLGLTDTGLNLLKKWDQSEFGNLEMDSSGTNFKGYLKEFIKSNRRDKK